VPGSELADNVKLWVSCWSTRTPICEAVGGAALLAPAPIAQIPRSALTNVDLPNCFPAPIRVAASTLPRSYVCAPGVELAVVWTFT
jgi:hypothetical protein